MNGSIFFVKEKHFHVVLWECWQGTHCMYRLKVNTASLCSFSESHPQPFFILVMNASFQWKVCSLTICLCLQVENGSDVVEVSNLSFCFLVFGFFFLKAVTDLNLFLYIFTLSLEWKCLAIYGQWRKISSSKSYCNVSILTVNDMLECFFS